MRPPLRFGQGALPIDVELRLNLAHSNHACSAIVDGEPDGVAHPKGRTQSLERQLLLPQPGVTFEVRSVCDQVVDVQQSDRRTESVGCVDAIKRDFTGRNHSKTGQEHSINKFQWSFTPPRPQRVATAPQAGLPRSALALTNC